MPAGAVLRARARPRPPRLWSGLRTPRRWRRFRGLAAAGLIAAAAPLAAAEDRPVRLADGRVLNAWCAGTRGPSVLLDGGWAADSRAWHRVLPLLADVRACAVDRAGAGRSSPGPLPRDASAVAADLAAALPGLGLPGPVILVGHSLGALHMRRLAMMEPDRVAALVLVDPSVPGQTAAIDSAGGDGTAALAGLIERAERCLAAARAGPIPPDDPALARCRTSPPERAAERWEARLSELQALEGATAAALAAQGPGGLDIPVIVLSAGRGRAGAAAALWARLHGQTAAISTRGKVILVPDSGHMMMFDRPDAIAAAVRAAAREAGP